MKAKKGEIGYIRYEKIRRFFVTIILFLIPAVIFISGYLYHGSKKNILTVVALVGCLPACKSTVGLIVMLMQKSPKIKLMKEIQSHAGKLTMAYEMIFTTYEKNAAVDAAVIHGHDILCFMPSPKAGEQKMIREHLEKMLKHNGYGVTVHILENKEKFIERLDAINKLNQGEEHASEFEEKIRHIMLNLVL